MIIPKYSTKPEVDILGLKMPSDIHFRPFCGASNQKIPIKRWFSSSFSTLTCYPQWIYYTNITSWCSLQYLRKKYHIFIHTIKSNYVVDIFRTLVSTEDIRKKSTQWLVDQPRNEESEYRQRKTHSAKISLTILSPVMFTSMIIACRISSLRKDRKWELMFYWFPIPASSYELV